MNEAKLPCRTLIETYSSWTCCVDEFDALAYQLDEVDYEGFLTVLQLDEDGEVLQARIMRSTICRIVEQNPERAYEHIADETMRPGYDESVHYDRIGYELTTVHLDEYGNRK